MLQAAGTKGTQSAEACMIDMCNRLFEKWLLDLTLEEKEIWLWNATVEFAKIKQRRKS